MATTESSSVIVYDVEHLATFSTQNNSFNQNDDSTGHKQQGDGDSNNKEDHQSSITTPKMALQKLFDLEKSSGIWTQRMQIELKENHMLIVDCETESTVERFPMSYIQQPAAFNHSNHIYNNIILFTIQNPNNNGPGELHIFQCVSHQAQQVVDDILNWKSGSTSVPSSSSSIVSNSNSNRNTNNNTKTTATIGDQNDTSDESIRSTNTNSNYNSNNNNNTNDNKDNNWSSSPNKSDKQDSNKHNIKSTVNGNNNKEITTTTTTATTNSNKPSSVLSSPIGATGDNSNKKIPVVNVNVKETVHVFNQIAAQREKTKPTSPITTQSSLPPSSLSARPNVIAASSQQITPNSGSSNSGRSSQASPTNCTVGQHHQSAAADCSKHASSSSPSSSSSLVNNQLTNSNKQPTQHQQQMPTIPYGTRAVLDHQHHSHHHHHHVDSRSSIVTSGSNESTSLAPTSSTGAMSGSNQQQAPAAGNMPAIKQQQQHHVNGQQQRHHHSHQQHHNTQQQLSNNNGVPIEVMQQLHHQRNIVNRHQAETNKKNSSSARPHQALSPPGNFMVDQVAPNDTETTKSYVSVLNHCFDDIEKFIMRLQHAAAAQRELQTRRNMRRSSGAQQTKSVSTTNNNNNGPSSASSANMQSSTGDGLLATRARGPNEEDFYEILCKFKLAFNLLAKLKGCIHDPNAPELVHFLFTPLAIIIDAARNSGPMPIDPTIVGVPYLNQDAIDLLSNCCTSKESDIWISLGPNWTQMIDPHLLQTSRLPSSFQPVFSDGWAPLITELELIGLVLPVPVPVLPVLPLMPVDVSMVEDGGHGNNLITIPGSNNNRVVDIDSDNNSTTTDTNPTAAILMQQQQQQQVSNSQLMLSNNQLKVHHQQQRHPRSSVPPPPLPKDNNNHVNNNDLMPIINTSDNSIRSSRASRKAANSQSYAAGGHSLITSQQYNVHHHHNNHHRHNHHHQQQQHHHYEHHHTSSSDNLRHHHQHQQHDLEHDRSSSSSYHDNHARANNRDDLSGHTRGLYLPSSTTAGVAGGAITAIDNGSISHHQHRSQQQQLLHNQRHHQLSNKANMPRPTSPMDSVEGEENLMCSTMDLDNAFDDAQLDWIAELQARNAKIVRVLFPFEANNEKELTVQRNEILEILDDSRKWWKARNIKSEVAHVPYTFVTELNAPMQMVKNDDPLPSDYNHHVRDQRQHHGAHNHPNHHMMNDNNNITSPSSSYMNNNNNNNNNNNKNNNMEWTREEKRGKAGAFRYF